MGCEDPRFTAVVLLVLEPNVSAFRLPLAWRLDVDCQAVVAPTQEDSDALPDAPAEPVRDCLRFISGVGRHRRALAYPLPAKHLCPAATRVDDATVSPTTAARSAPPGTVAWRFFFLLFCFSARPGG